MKLKYKLFLTIFPLTLLLVLLAFLFASQREKAAEREHLESHFAHTISAMQEFEAQQGDSFIQSLNYISQDPAWNAVHLEKDDARLANILTSLQKRTAFDLIIFLSPNANLRQAAGAGDGWKLDELRDSLSSILPRHGEARKKPIIAFLRGNLYQVAFSDIPAMGANGFLGAANLLPIGTFVRSASGLEVAVAGREGNWAGALIHSADDSLKLTNLTGEEIELTHLSSGLFYARPLKLDPNQPSLRLTLLAPTSLFTNPEGSLTPAFLFCMALAFAASLAISWRLSQSFSEPMEMVSQVAERMLSSLTPISTPLELSERKDEVGSVARSFNQLAKTLGDELKQKEKNLTKLEKYKTQLLELNHRLAKKLFENRVMLTLWREQEKVGDTKDLLSRVLEELLQGLPFHYGCIIIRPLAQIGPEVILARIERQRTGKEEISVTDILERSDRTHWLSSLSPQFKDFLLATNQKSMNNNRILHDVITAPIEPEAPVQKASVISLRLAQGGEYMGSLHLITEREPFSLSAPEEDFLLSLSGQISAALENRSLQYSTRVDPLTRLYNRGYMNDRLREEMLRTSRTNRPFTLMLLDIDHFKKVNDTYGHPAGDEVLLGMSALLKRSCRGSDAICRYGGEEIALILADTPLAGAKAFAENLLQIIAKESFSIPEGRSIRVTASLGLAEYPSQAKNIEELLKNADEALYKAKREGRNLWKAFSA